MAFSELTNEQRKVFVDSTEAFENLREAERQRARYRGSMTWKTINGTQYLMRASNRRGQWKSLGSKSADTDKIYSAFQSNKAEIEERYRSLRNLVELQAKYAKANRINRVPAVSAKVLRVLEQECVKAIVAGTHCLYAYEALAGVHFEKDLMTTRDLDVVFHPQRQLKVVCDEKPGLILDLLTKADKSFSRSGRSYRAVNQEGFMVDVISFAVGSPLKRNPLATSEDDLDIADVDRLGWLVSSPIHTQTAIAEDGMGARLDVPSPEHFAVHKFYLSTKPDRDPIKRPWDLAQAAAVADLIDAHLPMHGLENADLSTFPASLVESFMEWRRKSKKQQDPLNELGPGL